MALSLGLYMACQSETKPVSKAQAEQLAKIHCASCHQYPEPELLNKASWNEHILPRMGYMMGVLPEDSIGPNYIEQAARKVAFQNPMLFRKSTSLSKAEWKAIRNFYVEQAPANPIEAPKKEVTNALPLFEVNIPALRLSPPSTTMVKMMDNRLFIGDANTKRMYQFDQNMELQNAANLREGLVDLVETPSSFLATLMGSFSPTDAGTGMLLSLPKTPQGRVQVILDSLRRPVHSNFADLNDNQRMDIITCEFAKWTGCLSWWENTPSGEMKQHLLRNMPGAIKAYVYDFNKDSRPDIAALFGQGDEGIFIYYNQGNGQFKEEKVLSFPASYGSSYFNLLDFNQDGHVDIVYTAGDNADYPPPVKAYHGIYVFLNDGNNQFEQHFFYPMYGAYGAIPADFDLDGDIDMAAISFFPDYQNDGQSFLYLENQGDLNFKAFTFPEVNKGRWIVMDAGDPDQDGDLDLVLGSLAFEVVPANGLVQQWTKDGIPFIYLENKSR